MVPASLKILEENNLASVRMAWAVAHSPKSTNDGTIHSQDGPAEKSGKTVWKVHWK